MPEGRAKPHKNLETCPLYEVLEVEWNFKNLKEWPYIYSKIKDKFLCLIGITQDEMMFLSFIFFYRECALHHKVCCF